MINDYSIDLAKYRLEKAKETIEAANDLITHNHFNDAVGRCYYAIFSAMRALLALKKLDSKKHTGVIALFNQHFVKEKIFPLELQELIGQAKIIREKTDYGDFFSVPVEIARQHLKNASRFVQEVEKTIQTMINDLN